MKTLREIFEQMPDEYKTGKTSKELVYYFTLGKRDDEKWTVFCRPEECEVQQGKATDDADCVLKTSSKLFKKMVLKGWTPGAFDFMRGKVKTSDIDLLKRFKEEFFPGMA